MKAAKPGTKPFTGPLADEIVVPFRLPKVEADGKRLIGLEGFPEQLEKLALLAEHYGITVKEGDSAWALPLALALAMQFVPGFQIVYEDPLAAEFGLPMKAGPKSGRLGKMQLPELTGRRFIALVDLQKRAGGDTSDIEAINTYVDVLRPDLKHSSERRALVETLQTRLSKARREFAE